jgi:hypothetical protein
MNQISTTRAAGEGEERISPKTKEKKLLLQSKSSRSPTTKLINKSAIIKHSKQQQNASINVQTSDTQNNNNNKIHQ